MAAIRKAAGSKAAVGEAKATPRDFFLWLGAIIALYGSVSALIALIFHYIDRTFPDALTYIGDGSDIRFFTAALIVLVPVAIVLLRLIRLTIMADETRAAIWVRRWALVLTIFVAGAVVAVDLITLLYHFLNGETTVRFVLKVIVVLLVALGVMMHFLADLRGYWALHPRRAQAVGAAAGVLALATVIAGFFIVGSPKTARLERFDTQKVNDLQSIQYELVNFYQQTGELPETLDETTDPLNSFMLPSDPQSGDSYGYELTDDLSFRLCADFNLDSPEPAEVRDDSYAPRESFSADAPHGESWRYASGRSCFDRTIDPDRYPPFDDRS